jgi:hypothetical protein
MKSSTRFIVIASLAPIFISLSLSAMAENPPKHQEPAKAVQKLDMKKIDSKSKTGSKGSSSHAPLDGPQLSPDVGTAVDVIHGILGR